MPARLDRVYPAHFNAARRVAVETAERGAAFPSAAASASANPQPFALPPTARGCGCAGGGHGGAWEPWKVAVMAAALVVAVKYGAELAGLVHAPGAPAL